MTVYAMSPLCGSYRHVAPTVASCTHGHVELGPNAICDGIAPATDVDKFRQRGRVRSVVGPFSGLLGAFHAGEL
jgi:hypothetical protein